MDTLQLEVHYISCGGGFKECPEEHFEIMIVLKSEKLFRALN